MKKHLLLLSLLSLLAFSQAGWATTVYSQATNGTTNWNYTTFWNTARDGSGTASLAAGNDLVVQNGYTITINSNQTINSLTIEAGGTATFDATSRSIIVTTDISIAATGVFIVQSTTASHTMSIGGNLTNNGTFDMSRNSSDKVCSVIFNKNGDQTITGTGALTRFRTITLDKTNADNKVVCSRDVVFAGSGGLLLTKGTWEQNAATLIDTSGSVTLAGNGSLIFSGTGGYRCTVSGSVSVGAGVTVTINTSGTVRIGSGSNNLTNAGGTLNIFQGTVNIFGYFKNSSGTTTISETGGAGTTNININNSSYGNNSLDVPSSSNPTFNMSGGTIIVIDPISSSTAAKVDVSMSTSSTISITGGTIVLGDGTSLNTGQADSKGFFINTHTIPLWNLTINTGTAAGRQVTLGDNASPLLPRDLVVKNNLTIISGTLNANIGTGSNITLGGTFTNSGTFNGSTTSNYTFNGSGAQVSNILPLTINNLIINNSAGVTVFAPVTVTGVLTLTNGLLNTTQTNLPTLSAAATVTGGSNTSFVNGPISVTARNTIPMVAPVGSGSAYRPVTSILSITSGSGVFTVEQKESAPTGPIIPINVASMSSKRYFHVVETGNIVGTATLQLTWGADDGVVDITKMTVLAGTEGSQWYAENNSGTSVGVPAAGTVTTNAQATFLKSGDFTLGFYGNTKKYYSTGSGDLTVLTNWGTNLNGTGTNPTDFAQGNQIFVISNRAAASILSNWSIASNSKIVVGDGISLCNFTIPAAFSVTGKIDVADKSTLTLQNTIIPSLGTLTGTVVFAGSVLQTIPAATFTNLTINNASGVSLAAASTVKGVFTLTNGLVTTTSTNLLTLDTTSTVADGSDASFVNGPVSVIGRTSIPMVAPVGKGSAYRPLSSSLQISSGSGVFTVEQIESKPTGEIVPATNVVVISSRRYFHIVETGNIVGVGTIRLTWGADDGVVNMNKATVVAGTNNVQWMYDNHFGGYLGNALAGSVATDFQALNIASGDFTLGSYTNDPLPVNLSAFSALPVNGVIKLTWKTSVETDNHGFDVERSSDKSSWNNLAFIQGQGNSSTTKEYSYSDNKINKAGKYYYRLKQIDNNGGFKYSSIVEAVYAAPTVYTLNQNYPNPFNPNTVISYSLPLASNVKISVFNAIGETVQILENGFKEEGNYSVSLNATSMPSGIYFYRIEAGKFSQVKKMMVLK